MLMQCLKKFSQGLDVCRGFNISKAQPGPNMRVETFSSQSHDLEWICLTATFCPHIKVGCPKGEMCARKDIRCVSMRAAELVFIFFSGDVGGHINEANSFSQSLFLSISFNPGIQKSTSSHSHSDSPPKETYFLIAPTLQSTTDQLVPTSQR